MAGLFGIYCENHLGRIGFWWKCITKPAAFPYSTVVSMATIESNQFEAVYMDEAQTVPRRKEARNLVHLPIRHLQ